MALAARAARAAYNWNGRYAGGRSYGRQRKTPRRTRTPTRLQAASHLLELRDVTKAFGATRRAPRHRPEAGGGPIPRASRREWSRQVDPDQDPRRHSSSDPRRDAVRRRANRSANPRAAALARTPYRSSGFFDPSGPDGRSELRPRPGADRSAWLHRRRSARDELAARAKRFDVRFDPDTPAERLKIGDRKILEILKVLDERQKLLVLDEPTASFTTEETRRLLAILSELKALGTAILYVTHRLEEIEGMVDRVTVLRDGAKVGELTRAEATQERVVSLMVGRDLGQMYPRACDAARRNAFVRDGNPARRRVRGCEPRGPPRRDRRARRSRRSRKLRGRPQPRRPASAGRGRNPESTEGPSGCAPFATRSASGIGFLAEDRADTILRVRTVRENLALGALEMWSRMGFVDTRREADEADRLIKALSVRCRSSIALAESAQRRQPAEARARPLARRRPRGSSCCSIRPQASMSARAPRSISISAISPRAARGVLIATSDLVRGARARGHDRRFLSRPPSRDLHARESVRGGGAGRHHGPENRKRSGMTRLNRRTVGPIVLVVVGAVLAYFLVPRFGTRINIGYFLLQSVAVASHRRRTNACYPHRRHRPFRRAPPLRSRAWSPLW